MLTGTGPVNTKPFIVSSSPWKLLFKAKSEGHFAVELRGPRIELVINQKVLADQINETYIYNSKGSLYFHIQQVPENGDWTLWVIDNKL